MDTAIKALLLISFLGLAGCGADIAVRPSLGVSVGPAYPAYYGGGGYRPHWEHWDGGGWGRWHRRGWR